MKKLIKILAFLLASAAPVAFAQEPQGQPNAIDAISPGTPVVSYSISCTSAGTTLFQHASGNAVLVSDGTRIVLENGGSESATCAFLANPSCAIGDVTNASTQNTITDPNSDNGNGSTFAVPTVGAAMRYSWRAHSHSICGRQQWCTEPVTDTPKNSYTAAHMTCLSNAECASIQGTPASATCTTTSRERATVAKQSDAGRYGKPSAFVGCRCSGTTILRMRIER